MNRGSLNINMNNEQYDDQDEDSCSSLLHKNDQISKMENIDIVDNNNNNNNNMNNIKSNINVKDDKTNKNINNNINNMNHKNKLNRKKQKSDNSYYWVSDLKSFPSHSSNIKRKLESRIMLQNALQNKKDTIIYQYDFDSKINSNWTVFITLLSTKSIRNFPISDFDPFEFIEIVDGNGTSYIYRLYYISLHTKVQNIQVQPFLNIRLNMTVELDIYHHHMFLIMIVNMNKK